MAVQLVANPLYEHFRSHRENTSSALTRTASYENLDQMAISGVVPLKLVTIEEEGDLEDSGSDEERRNSEVALSLSPGGSADGSLGSSLEASPLSPPCPSLDLCQVEPLRGPAENPSLARPGFSPSPQISIPSADGSLSVYQLMASSPTSSLLRG